MISAWLCYGFFEYKKLIIHFNIKRAIHHIKYYLKIGLPFVPSALASWVIIWSNRWIILYYLDENEVGIYSIASKFGGVYEALILTPIITAVVPSILKRFSEKKYELYKRYILPLAVVFFLIFGLCLQYVAKFVVNETFHNALPLIFFFSIPYCFQFFSYYLNIPLLFNKNTLYTSGAFIAASIVTVSSNIILVPIYHLYGGILGNACGYFVFFVIIFIKSNKVVSTLQGRI
jgi:O-antigen/teichoic acid export membrane protein